DAVYVAIDPPAETVAPQLRVRRGAAVHLSDAVRLHAAHGSRRQRDAVTACPVVQVHEQDPAVILDRDVRAGLDARVVRVRERGRVTVEPRRVAETAAATELVRVAEAANAARRDVRLVHERVPRPAAHRLGDAARELPLRAAIAEPL